MEIKREYDFAQVGKKDMYLLHHEEIESLAKNIPGVKRIRFFMTFGQSYLTHMRCLENVGMLRTDPVSFQGTEIVPIQFLKALLPDEGGKEKGTMENGAAGENGEREKREVLEALSRLYDVTALKDKVILVKTAEKAVGKDFSEFLLNQLFSQEERRRLGY